MKKDWVKVFTSANSITTDLVKKYLEDFPMDVVCLNKQDSVYHFGVLELYVAQKNFQAAIEIIIGNDF